MYGGTFLVPVLEFSSEFPHGKLQDVRARGIQKYMLMF